MSKAWRQRRGEGGAYTFGQLQRREEKREGGKEAAAHLFIGACMSFSSASISIVTARRSTMRSWPAWVVDAT